MNLKVQENINTPLKILAKIQRKMIKKRNDVMKYSHIQAYIKHMTEYHNGVCIKCNNGFLRKLFHDIEVNQRRTVFVCSITGLIKNILKVKYPRIRYLLGLIHIIKSFALNFSKIYMPIDFHSPEGRWLKVESVKNICARGGYRWNFLKFIKACK